jgi:glycosyltransferase involved in cell wall biosynthesis
LVNRTDVCGGAEIVATDQLHSYLSLGHDVKLLVGRKQDRNPHVMQVGDGRPGPAAGRRNLWEVALDDADIVHFHNLHGNYFEQDMIPALSRSKVVCMTLHDQYAFTGGCVHSYDCTAWRTGCGNCPQLDGSAGGDTDRTAEEWARKRQLWARAEIDVIAPARWIYDRACLSILNSTGTQVWHIPNGVDTRLFARDGEPFPRAQLGLSPGELLLLAVGQKIRSNRSKDWSLLMEALRLAGERIETPATLIVMGDEGEETRFGKIRVCFAGMICDRTLVANYYAGADIFIHSSRAETFSLSVLEAMATGCAVVATDVGGINEQLRPHPRGNRDCGLVVPPGDARALASAIEVLARNSELRAALSAMAVDRVARWWTLERHVDAHLKLYTHRQR